MRIFFCVSFFFQFLILSAFSQQSLNSSGGEAVGLSNVSYSVGQVFFNYNTDTNTNYTEGVQQPFEISEIISNTDHINSDLIISFFPNPVYEKLNINIDNYTENLSFELLDVLGQRLKNDLIRQNHTIIDFDGLNSNIYFLNVLSDDKIVKTIKISKFK